MADCITVVTSGWHSKQTVPVAFEPGVGLLQLKDRIRAALDSAAQGQVDLTSLHGRRAQQWLSTQAVKHTIKQPTYLTAAGLSAHRL